MPYRRATGVRLRPVPELGTCLAFTATPPRLHTLNPVSWLIAELCGTGGRPDLDAEFVRRSVPPLRPDQALETLSDGLAQLEAAGIVTREPEEDPT